MLYYILAELSTHSPAPIGLPAYRQAGLSDGRQASEFVSWVLFYGQAQYKFFRILTTEVKSFLVKKELVDTVISRSAK
jgi:hypothetical protein